MKRLLLTLAVLVVASPSFATTLTYKEVDGTATLDPSTSPSGKMLGFLLNSNNAFFVDATRTAAFPGIFFTNTAGEISDSDSSLQGTSAVYNLKQLFPTPVHSLNELTAKFTGRTYVGSLGGGELNINLVFVPGVPEPATLGLSGLGLLGLAAFRRRRVG